MTVSSTMRAVTISLLVVIGSLLWTPFEQAQARTVLPTRGAPVAHAVVYDVTRHSYTTYAPPTQFVTGSAMKVPILLTFLDLLEQQGRRPSRQEVHLMTIMIENSDNDAASAIYYGKIGGAVGVTHFLQRLGITGIISNAHAWGWSLIIPEAMVSLLRTLCQLPPVRDRRLVRYTWTPPHLSVPLQAHCFGFVVRCIRGH